MINSIIIFWGKEKNLISEKDSKMVFLLEKLVLGVLRIDQGFGRYQGRIKPLYN